MSLKARFEPALRLFKNTVLILSLFATQGIVWYFSARNVGSAHAITTATASIQSVEVAYNRRKLLEVDESSNSSPATSIIFLNLPWQNLSSKEKVLYNFRSHAFILRSFEVNNKQRYK